MTTFPVIELEDVLLQCLKRMDDDKPPEPHADTCCKWCLRCLFCESIHDIEVRENAHRPTLDFYDGLQLWAARTFWVAGTDDKQEARKIIEQELKSSQSTSRK